MSVLISAVNVILTRPEICLSFILEFLLEFLVYQPPAVNFFGDFEGLVY